MPRVQFAGGASTTRPVPHLGSCARPQARVKAPRARSVGTRLRSGVQCRADSSAGRLFVWGLGYTGLGVANHLLKQGWRVEGTCRTADKAEALAARGFPAHVFDPDNDVGLSTGGLAALRGASHILTTVPPVADFDDDPVLLLHEADLRALGGQARWVGYLSSTSVYGDWRGAWVDERSELRAASGKGAARVRAEARWLALWREAALPVHIFRLGGIYGPGRSALQAAAAQGPGSASQQRRARTRYTARCHVLDIARALAASMAAPAPGEVYNLVDDDPASRGEVVKFARSLLHPEASRADAADPASAAASNLDGEPVWRASGEPAASVEEKRVRNGRVKGALGFQFEFPSYREGLAAIHAGDQRPFE